MATSLEFRSLSKELQLLIVESCDMPTLYHLCLTNRELYSMAEPVLWKTIDFVNAVEQHDISEWQRRFFASCDIIRSEYPERWNILASRVEILQIGRLAGPQISQQSLAELDAFNESVFYCGPGHTTIFDIIAHFINLKTLTLFLKNDWNGPSSDRARALRQNLTKLTTLKLGGQIDPGHVSAFLTRPSQMESLALINFVRQADQTEGPHPYFLHNISFPSLKTLHLSKLADFDISEDYNPIPEQDCLESWNDLLRSVSQTLVDLTLELCYAKGANPQDAEPRSEKQCREALLPVLLETDWLKLERLTWIGFDSTSFEGLPDRIKVECLPERQVEYYWDVTPIEVSPPNELFV